MSERCLPSALPKTCSSDIVSYVLEPPGQLISRLPATRDAAPRRRFVSVVNDGRKATPFLVGLLRRKGHFKSAGSRNQAGCLGGFPTVVRRHQSSQSLARIVRAGSMRRLVAARGTRVHRMRHQTYRLAAEERLNQAQVIFLHWLTSLFRLRLHAAEDGQRLTRIRVREARMASAPWV